MNEICKKAFLMTLALAANGVHPRTFDNALIGQPDASQLRVRVDAYKPGVNQHTAALVLVRRHVHISDS